MYILQNPTHIQLSSAWSARAGTFFERSTPRVQESHKAHALGDSNFSMWAGIIIVGNLTRRQQHFVVAWCLIALIRTVLHRLYNKKLMRLVLGIHDGVDHLDTAWRSCGTKIAQGERRATNGYMNVTRRSRENLYKYMPTTGIGFPIIIKNPFAYLLWTNLNRVLALLSNNFKSTPVVGVFGIKLWFNQKRFISKVLYIKPIFLLGCYASKGEI